MSDPMIDTLPARRPFGPWFSALMAFYVIGILGLLWQGPLSFRLFHFKLGPAEFTGLFLIIIGGVFFAHPSRRKEAVDIFEEWLVARGGMSLLIGGVTLFLLWTQLYRHWAFQTQAYDLRLHEELIRNTWLGKFMYSDLLGHSYFGHHVVLLFPLLAPFYILWPSPVALLVLQTVFICGAAWFLWDIAVRKGIRPLLAASITLTFLAYRGMTTGYYEGFHQEVVAIFFLLGCLRAESLGQTKHYLLWAILAMACREDIAVMIAIYSGCRAFKFSPMRPTFILVAVLGLVWAIIAYGIIIPAYASAGMVELKRWTFWGSTPSTILKGLFSHPVMVLEKLFHPSVIRLFALLLFLPLTDWIMGVTIIIPLIANVTSDFPLQAHLGGAYAAMLVPFLFRGLLYGLTIPVLKRAMNHVSIATTVALLLLILNLRNPPMTPRADGLREAHQGLTSLRFIFNESSVLAQGCLMPHIGWPRTSAMLGSPLAETVEHYDVVVLSEQLNPWPLSQRQVADLSQQLQHDSTWRLQQMGVVSFFSRCDHQSSSRGLHIRNTKVMDKEKL